MQASACQAHELQRDAGVPAQGSTWLGTLHADQGRTQVGLQASLQPGGIFIYNADMTAAFASI